MAPLADPEPLVLVGRLVDGLGEGRRFVALDWVRDRFRSILGADPYPGTVNLRVETASGLAALACLRAAPGIPIPPEPGFCPATAHRAAIRRPPSPEVEAPCAGGGPVPAAIIFPDVPGYPQDQVELVAPVHVRTALGLRAGDPVMLLVSLRG